MRIIRMPETLHVTGDTRSPLFQKVSDGLFPRQVKLGGGRAAGWPENEVEAVVAARIAGVPDDAVRTLVTQLHEARGARFQAVRAALVASTAPSGNAGSAQCTRRAQTARLGVPTVGTAAVGGA
jgi:prophage regulatory protein